MEVAGVRVFTGVCVSQQQSPLPLTDPRDAADQRMLNKPYRIIVVIKPFLLLGLTADHRSRRRV